MMTRFRTRILCLLTILGLLAVTGCGFDAQTLQPYTPAMGVNVDVGPARLVKVRNLLIVSRFPGQGFLSTSILADERPDALVEVSGFGVGKDQLPGAPLESNLATPLPLPADELVVLTRERPVIRVSSPDLPGGGAARVTLRFERAGEVTLLVPIYENVDPLETISPIPRSSSGA
jgi:hypothetical protein